MHVEILSTSHDDVYERFLQELGQSCPAVLGYHFPFYRDMLVSLGVGEPLYLGAFSGDELVGVLPGFVKRTSVGTAYCSLPFYGPNAGILSRVPVSLDVHGALLKYVIAFMEREAAPITASFYTPFLSGDYPLYDSYLEQSVITIDKETLYLDLARTDKWEKGINRDIRYAIGRGVVVSQDVPADRFSEIYHIYERNCRDYGIPPKPERAIHSILTEGVRTNHAVCYAALHEKKVVGALIMMLGPKTASYYLPCTLHEARGLQPGSLLIHHAVEDARKRGILFWNWEATPPSETGVYRFKKKWGSIDGSYKIYVKRFRSEAELANIGRDILTAEFPYFFIYPYSRLENLPARTPVSSTA